jgi:hypothetical protein
MRTIYTTPRPHRLHALNVYIIIIIIIIVVIRCAYIKRNVRNVARARTTDALRVFERSTDGRFVVSVTVQKRSKRAPSHENQTYSYHYDIAPCCCVYLWAGVRRDRFMQVRFSPADHAYTASCTRFEKWISFTSRVPRSTRSDSD